MNSVYPPCCFLSLVVGADSWLKGESGILALADGRGRDVQGKPETESCEVSDLHDPEDLIKIPQRNSPSRDTVPSAPLFWLSLLEVCCRPPWVSPWSLSAALGTQAACECVRAGGVEDAVAVKGML